MHKTELLEWTLNFIDNLNSFRRNLESKSVLDNRIICTYKDKGEHTYVVAASINSDIIKGLNGSIVLVCLNSKENLSTVIENWGILIRNPKLKIIFVNLLHNLQWSLIPFTHNLVSDPASLKLGLKTLFETVPEV
jgi:hypothetical protein